MNVKPCPFCGEDAVIEYGAHGSRSFPMCSNKLCPAGKGGTFDFERWNMRSIEDGLRAKNDRLQSVFLRHEHIQADGKLGVSVSDVVFENERLSALVVDLKQALKEMTELNYNLRAALDAAGGTHD